MLSQDFPTARVKGISAMIAAEATRPKQYHLIILNFKVRMANDWDLVTFTEQFSKKLILFKFCTFIYWTNCGSFKMSFLQMSKQQS